MKKQMTQTSIKNVLILLALVATSMSFGQVGINTTNPTEVLHVDGNVRIDGELKPGNVTGLADQILLSQGTGAPAAWGPQFLNTTQITGIGKYFTPVFTSLNGTYSTVSVLDPNMTADSVVSFNFVGPMPIGPQYGNNVRVMAIPNLGSVTFHITNVSGGNLANIQIAYVAYYH
ncbi:hypothetical protein G5B37_12090 [Rasiella rasia]|uniref:Uncharacterized protein n=1 Tax=Rasiella rasia TaxID=2744027 RepID=A0A6G6GP65_9FLAO|nr:hypothetical protein [Rasiella rasia]QIE60274.1 hypothetical protein G5B37_12090 [Rasiella rasia]